MMRRLQLMHVMMMTEVLRLRVAAQRLQGGA